MSKIKQEASLDSLSDSIFPSPDISPVEEGVVVEKTAPVEVTPTIAKTYEDFPADDLYTYAGLDCIATSTVLREIFPTLTEVRPYTYSKNNQRVLGKAPSIITSINDVEMKAFEYILDLEINGIQYDISKNREYHNRMVEEISFLEDRIFTSIGKRVNLDSGTIVAELLYLNMGMTAPKATKSGDDSTDGEALLMLAGLPIDGSCYTAPDPSKQFLADMAKRKDISSVHNTFIKTYIEDFVKRDGRVHPSYNLHGTSSFRITGSDPNLTQLPRPKHGYNVRECYTVAPGHIFIAADWSSAEVKILGALSRDPSLLRAIQDGLDFHSYSASQMAGVPYEQFIEAIENKAHADYKKYKLLRQRAKALTFGILYGSTANGIALNLGISLQEAEELINLYFSKFPGIKDYITNTHREALWNKYVLTPFGQRRMEYGAHQCFKGTAAYNASMRNAQNVRIQSTTSTAGLITFAAANEGVKRFDGKSICTVYDSAEFEVPLSRGAEVVEEVFYYFDDWPVKEFDFLDLPIGCEVEIGTNWGNCTTVHRGITQQELEQVILELA